jgi:hypothetical protein
MKSGICVCAAALAAFVAAFAAPVAAQEVDSVDDLTPAQRAEIFCVHNKLIANNGVVAVGEAYSDQLDDALAEKAETVLAAAEAECAKFHGWDVNKRDVGKHVGAYAAASEYFAGMLLQRGVKQEMVTRLFAITDNLPDDDYYRLFDLSWNGDEKFEQRLDAMLVAEGFAKDDTESLAAARVLMETVAMTFEEVWIWVEEYIE